MKVLFVVFLIWNLMACVAWGETVCLDKTVGGKWVSSSCTSNGGETVTGYIDTRNPHWIPVIEDKPTYVVMHGTTTATRVMVERIGARVEARVPCGNDDETCSDLAEALNEAHRRRVK